MKFLCDVHISYKLVNHLISLGAEALHVNNILDKWNTTDKDICEYADSNDYIIISKDSDFRDSFFVRGTPRKLLKINLGNISNQEIIAIFTENISAIQNINANPSFLIEIDKKIITYQVKK